ncbi:MAG: DUF1992 domain-containing protein [Anaerolineaceae bacterium]|nr:DUF1992 domain-containing protein [Anaerolineaceae bacterium]
MKSLEKIAEQKILAAIRAGEFDDLQGKGKRLLLEENTFVPDDFRLANKVLINAGYKLAWIESWQDIEQEIRSLRDSFQSTWHYAQLDIEKIQCQRMIAEKIGTINKKILDYNLSVPLPEFQKSILKLEKEIESLTTADINTK